MVMALVDYSMTTPDHSLSRIPIAPNEPVDICYSDMAYRRRQCCAGVPWKCPNREKQPWRRCVREQDM